MCCDVGTEPAHKYGKQRIEFACTMKFDDVFSVHPQALLLHERRAEVLASNLANADTPGYKARDFDFHKVLKMENNNEGRLATIRGLVTPVAWDDKGNVLAAAISTHFEEEYLVDDNARGEELIAFLRQRAKVSGFIIQNANGKKVITVKNYEVFEE